MGFEEKCRIILIDDEPRILDSLADTIHSMGFQSTSFSDPAAAIESLNADCSNVILIISDYRMPEMNGLELRRLILNKTRHIPYLIVSGHVSREEALRAIDLKVSGFLAKPTDEAALIELIKRETAPQITALKEEHEVLLAFIADVDLLIEQLEELLLSLESDPGNQEIVNRIFAVAHTIKGGSGFFKPDTLHRFTHRFEDFLSTYKKNGTAVPQSSITVLLNGLDTIKMLTDDVRNGNSEPRDLEKLVKIFEVAEDGSARGQQAGADGAKKGVATQARDEVRVSTKLLDEFMGLSGEITVLRNMINKLVTSIEKTSNGNKDVALLSELLEEMHKINSRLQDKVVDLRKVSVKSIVRPLPRTLRDVATTLGKDIRFETVGEDLRVDTTIAEVLTNSLTHMIRNGADHAVEAPEEREKQGKPRQGYIRISSTVRGDNVVVTIEDDGRGINPDYIKKKALEKGLITKERAERMSVSEIQALIFESGFSTAAAVTDVSGRGVGMDMVMKAVTNIGGKIDVKSHVGQGTRFDLILPIPKTVNIIGALLVRSSDQIYCIPQDSVFRLLTLSNDDVMKQIRHTQGSDFLQIHDDLYQIVNLDATLRHGKDEATRTQIRADRETIHIVLVKIGGTTFGIVVDEILDLEDIVVKDLAPNFRKIGVFAGATFLGDGRVGMILKPEGLAELNDITVTRSDRSVSNDSERDSENLKDAVIFNLRSPGLYGVYLDNIFRLERFSADQVQYSGEQPVVVYRGSPIPVLDLTSELGLGGHRSDVSAQNELPCLIVRSGTKTFGLAVDSIVDLQRTPQADPVARDRDGILGSTVLGAKTVTMVDALSLVGSRGATVHPLHVPDRKPSSEEADRDAA